MQLRCPAARTPTRDFGTAADALPSQAIQNPGDLRLQERAWSAVCPLVAKLKRFYEFSLRLGESLSSPASSPSIPQPCPEAPAVLAVQCVLSSGC